MVTPAARMRWARPVASRRIWAGVMVAPICLAEGIDPTRFAIRWITPPSSSVITNGAMPSGAEETRLRRATPRSEGADAPRRITPPTPAATSGVTDATSLSSTGTTTVCSARRRTLQVAIEPGLGQATVDAGIGGVVVVVVVPDEAAVPPHPDTNETTSSDHDRPTGARLGPEAIRCA